MRVIALLWLIETAFMAVATLAFRFGHSRLQSAASVQSEKASWSSEIVGQNNVQATMAESFGHESHCIRVVIFWHQVSFIGWRQWWPAGSVITIQRLRIVAPIAVNVGSRGQPVKDPLFWLAPLYHGQNVLFSARQNRCIALFAPFATAYISHQVALALHDILYADSGQLVPAQPHALLKLDERLPVGWLKMLIPRSWSP